MDCRVALKIGDDVSDMAARRIAYAFKLFAAVFGFTSVNSWSEWKVRLCYGSPPSTTGDIALHCGYTPRDKFNPAPHPCFVDVNTDKERLIFPVFHGLDEKRKEPDWLGEIFEWVSGAHEFSIDEYKTRGDAFYPQTLHGLYCLTPHIPYATIAMHCLNRRIKKQAGSEWPDGPCKPPGIGTCAFVPTHDLDFFPCSITSVLQRYLKNIAISLVKRKDFNLFLSVLCSPLRVVQQEPWLHDCLERTYSTEYNNNIQASLNVISKKARRRDANYHLHNRKLLAKLKKLSSAGVEIGVHGSCSSLEEPYRLAEEYQKLTDSVTEPAGGRQHLLRYDISVLFKELTRANALYDCSSGYNTHMGFRQGICSPYPPYNFDKEEPYPLLEVPLVMMDNALYTEFNDPNDALDRAQQLLRDIRRHGWGGCSILWHDTAFSGAHFPRHIENAYWCLQESEDQWISPRTLIDNIWTRYSNAGLLPAQDEIHSLTSRAHQQ